MIKGSRTVYIDPFQVENGKEKADILLITHEHYDHCSVKDAEKVVDENTIIITVADCQSKLSGLNVKSMTLVEPGSKLEVQGVTIEAVPSYNTNKQFQQKEQNWVGFIITIDGKRVYHSGDTDIIPEMEAFTNIDVALLPVSGTYVMTAMEAAEACKKINPKLAIPMHYGAIIESRKDAEIFKQKAGCRVEII